MGNLQSSNIYDYSDEDDNETNEDFVLKSFTQKIV